MSHHKAHHHKKERRKHLLRIVIILLVVHVLLNIIKVPVTVVGHEEVVVQHNLTNTDQEAGLERRRVCEYLDYNWTYDWDGYEATDRSHVVPRYRLINREEKSGKFQVQFGFFDEAEHKFQQYDGIEYDKISHVLPWGEAAMVSEIINVPLEPYNNRIVTAHVQKADSSAIYWVYARVTPPKLTKCDYIYEPGLVNRTRTENTTSLRQVNRTEHYTMWQLLVRTFS